MKLCAWNVSKGLARKLSNKEFLCEITDYDILFFYECWVKYPEVLELEGFDKKCVFREKCNGGGIAIFYRKWLSPYIEFLNSSVDSIIWFKINKSLLYDNKDMYICASYVPPDKNVFYRKYECDVFEVIEQQIEHYNGLGNIAVIGDLNGRIGSERDFIEQDILDNHLRNNIFAFIDYELDIPSDRKTEDLKPPNTFGRKILNMCKSTGLRVCNGRFGDESAKITFQNKNGCSIIDYLLLNRSAFDNISDFIVGKFNTFSCHAPLLIDIKLSHKFNIEKICTCKTVKYNTFKWDEGQKDCVREELLNNSDKIEKLMNDISEESANIDNIVQSMNAILSDVADKYIKTEVTKTVKCDYCISKQRKNGVDKRTYRSVDKPWINTECKELYIKYKRTLSDFNKIRSNENRLILNLAKQKYKCMEKRLKSRYKHQRGNMLNSLKKTNPKCFYRKFRKRRKTVKHNISLNDFMNHFKNLVNRDDIATFDNNGYSEVIFEELDRPFTEREIDICIKKLKNDKSPGYDNILNEFIKEGKNILLPLFCNLFNAVLYSGWYPEIWVKSVLVPLFKKGPVEDAGNYRGISLVSHVGKLFTSTLYNRLIKWSNENSILTDAQFGFIPGYGTRDAIFALHSIIAKSLSKGKRLYCCFVDYVKAFDSVIHYILWQKMLKYGISGNLLNLIMSMYSKLKTCVKLNGEFSEFFSSNVGLMQGESLSPFLYAIYVNRN